MRQKSFSFSSITFSFSITSPTSGDIDDSVAILNETNDILEGWRSSYYVIDILSAC